MYAGNFYDKVGETSTPDDIVKIIDKNSGITYDVNSIKREVIEGVSTLWVEVEESA